MIDILPVRIRQLLAELEMLPHGKVASLNPTVRGGERDPRPQGESKPPHDDLRRKYLRAYSDDERADIEQEMIRQLKEFKGIKKPKPPVVSDADIDKELGGFAGWTPNMIARRSGNCITEKRIRQWRESQGLDGITGYALKPVVTDDDKRSTVHFLKSCGAGTTEIAQRVGWSKQRVSAMLKRAA